MISIFATPKPFIGHIGTIQRNAIISWTKLRPKPEILLFGTDHGIKDISKELDLIHIPSVAANEYNTPLVNDIFRRAQEKAKYPILGFINPDLILLDDFMPAIKKATAFRKQFLLAGERWDLDVKERIDFNNSDWQKQLRKKLKTEGKEHGYGGVDYFVFPKGVFDQIPAFAVGRPYYDNWFFWKINAKSIPIIDASKSILSIHQNHERTYSSMGKAPIKGENQFRKGIEAEKNFTLCGGNYKKIYNILSATHILSAKGIESACTPERLHKRVLHLEFREKEALTHFKNYTEKIKSLTAKKDKIDQCLDKSNKDIEILESSIISKAFRLLKKRKTAALIFGLFGILFVAVLFLLGFFFGGIGISYLLGFGIFSLIVIAIEFYRRLYIYNKSRFDKLSIDSIINNVNLGQQISQLQNCINLTRERINQILYNQNKLKKEYDEKFLHQRQTGDKNTTLINEISEKQNLIKGQLSGNVAESNDKIDVITHKLNQYEQQLNQLQEKAKTQEDATSLQSKANQDILEQLNQLQKQTQAQQDTAKTQSKTNQKILSELNQLQEKAQTQQNAFNTQKNTGHDILNQLNQLQQQVESQHDAVQIKNITTQDILKRLNQLQKQANNQHLHLASQNKTSQNLLKNLEETRAKINEIQDSFNNIQQKNQDNLAEIRNVIEYIRAGFYNSEQLNEIQDQVDDIEKQLFIKPEDKNYIYLSMLRKSDRFKKLTEPEKTGIVKVETFWGKQMTAIFPDDVSVNIYRKGFYEKGLSVMILKYLKSGMVFFDIGAHIGFYTLLASEIVGKNGQVHSFEPTPEVFNILRTNTVRKSNVFLIKRALWSSQRRMVFKDFGLNWSAFNSFFEPRINKEVLKKIKCKKHTLSTVTLDKYVVDKKIKPDFIKIDAESAEYDIVKGAEKTIKKYHPIISVEVGDEDIKEAKPSKALIEYVMSKGYTPYEFNRGVIVKHSLKNSYPYDNIFFLSTK